LYAPIRFAAAVDYSSEQCFPASEESPAFAVEFFGTADILMDVVARGIGSPPRNGGAKAGTQNEERRSCEEVLDHACKKCGDEDEARRVRFSLAR
jgi:hypothetical protein